MNRDRILIIDDDLEIWKAYQSILAPEQETYNSPVQKISRLIAEDTSITAPTDTEFQLRFASQGKEGFELVQESIKQNMPYAVAIIDIRMPPGWDGVKTAKQIRGIDQNIEIVFVTAYSDYSLSEIVQTVGTPDKLMFLRKPFDPEEITQLAVSLTKKWNLARQQEIQQAELETRVEERTAALAIVNEKLKAEDKLRRQEELYRTLVESAPY